MEYKVISFKEGDSLYSLFGDCWRDIYFSDLNTDFRVQFPDPDRIWAGANIRIPIDFITSNKYFLSSFSANAPKKVRIFCCVTGNFRSGTTIVTRILNLHTEICISLERDIIRTIKSVNESFAEITQFESLFRQNPCNLDKVTVIGDKQPSNEDTYSTKNMDNLFDILAGIEVRFIHCIRNPIENIYGRSLKLLQSERCNSSNKKYVEPQNLISWYFSNLDLIEDIVCKYKIKRLFVFNEELINKPDISINKMYSFLGVPCDDSTIQMAKSQLFLSPRIHDKVLGEWSDKDTKKVHDEIKKREYLERYLI